MKINNINIQNFCGLTSLVQETPAPITLFAGHNKVGKSSAIEAINLALTGEYKRVGRKKDLNQLVNNQADKGSITISTDQGDSNINLPTGSGTQIGKGNKWLTLSLIHGMFTAMSLDDQRQAIFDLSQTNLSDQLIYAELVKRGYDGKKVTQLDLSNLNKATDQACDLAKQARAGWKAITGEKYGSVKAETWQAQVVVPQIKPQAQPVPSQTTPTVEPVAEGRIEHLQQDLEKAIQEKASLEARLQTSAEHNRRHSFLKSEVAQGEEVKAKLKAYQAQLAETNSKIETLQASSASDELKALVADKLDVLNSKLVHEGRESWYYVKFHEESNEPNSWGNYNDCYDDGFEVGFKQGQYELLTELHNAMQSTDDPQNLSQYRQEANSLNAEIGKLSERLADLANKQTELDGMTEMVVNNQVEAQVVDLDGHITTTRKLIADLQEQQRQYNAQANQAINANAQAETQQRLQEQAEQQARQQAEQTTANALAYHQQVQMWVEIAELLSPAGEIGKMLEQAIEPFNTQLQSASDCIGWDLVKFDYELGMTFDNRPYHLLSESEKWRVDTAVSYAISQLSSMYIFGIDRFDVLDLPSRLPVLKWLDGLANLGSVDSVVVAGTFKEPVQAPSTFNSVWLGEGEPK